MSLEKNIERLQSIDALRGLVIIIMLLDHVRETFYLHKQVTDPNGRNSNRTSIIWQSIIGPYLCSGFVLLTGISAFYFSQKNKIYSKHVLFIKAWLIFDCTRAHAGELCMDSNFST